MIQQRDDGVYAVCDGCGREQFIRKEWTIRKIKLPNPWKGIFCVGEHLTYCCIDEKCKQFVEAWVKNWDKRNAKPEQGYNPKPEDKPLHEGYQPEGSSEKIKPPSKPPKTCKCGNCTCDPKEHAGWNPED